MKIKVGKEQEYKNWLDQQTDGYSKACFVFAEAWAGMLEAKMLMGYDPEYVITQYADKYSKYANKVAGGITGFMYGVAVSILYQEWEYGPIINRWHNKKYGCEDEDGTVNPATLTLEVKK